MPKNKKRRKRRPAEPSTPSGWPGAMGPRFPPKSTKSASEVAADTAKSYSKYLPGSKFRAAKRSAKLHQFLRGGTRRQVAQRGLLGKVGHSAWPAIVAMLGPYIANELTGYKTRRELRGQVPTALELFAARRAQKIQQERLFKQARDNPDILKMYVEQLKAEAEEQSMQGQPAGQQYV